MHRLLFLALLCAATPAAQQPDKPKLRIRPGFSDTYQVGFALIDKDGKPQRITFDDKGGTNVVVVRIDGKDYAFGFEGGVFKSKNAPLGKDRIGVKLYHAQTRELLSDQFFPSRTAEVSPDARYIAMAHKDTGAIMVWAAQPAPRWPTMGSARLRTASYSNG